MKKTKILLISSLLIFVGIVVFVGGMTMLKWNFKNLTLLKYDTHSYMPHDSFTKISVDTTTADIIFVATNDEKASIVCYEKERMNHTVYVENNELVIKLNDTRKWYHFIGFDFDSPKITVNLPKQEYDLLKISASTGNTKIPEGLSFKVSEIALSTGDNCTKSGDVNLSATTGDISVSGLSYVSLSATVSTGDMDVRCVNCSDDIALSFTTGDIEVENVTCNSIYANGSTGDVELNNVIASAFINIKTSTGDIQMERCDAGELKIEASTGDIKGTLLSEKIFIARTDTGRVDVPRGTSGGLCEITTDTGDIKITIQ